MGDVFDLVIVGGGPAALAAALYGARAELRTLVLERALIGGQVAVTSKVENYPGFPDGIEGPELIGRMEKQAARFGAAFRNEEVTRVDLDGDTKVVTTTRNVYRAAAVILATGADARKLGVEGEDELRGRGVSYCGTCDAPLFRDRAAVVVGGGNSALTEALFLARFASRVTVLHRRDRFRGDNIYAKQVHAHPKIAVGWDSVVERINGTEKVQSVSVRNVKTDAMRELPCDGVFIFIGHEPNTAFLANLFPDEHGDQIETDVGMMTSIPGIFVIGDVRKHSFRQIATAVGEGATAAIAAERWLAERPDADA